MVSLYICRSGEDRLLFDTLQKSRRVQLTLQQIREITLHQTPLHSGHPGLGRAETRLRSLNAENDADI